MVAMVYNHLLAAYHCFTLLAADLAMRSLQVLGGRALAAMVEHFLPVILRAQQIRGAEAAVLEDQDQGRMKAVRGLLLFATKPQILGYALAERKQLTVCLLCIRFWHPVILLWCFKGLAVKRYKAVVQHSETAGWMLVTANAVAKYSTKKQTVAAGVELCRRVWESGSLSQLLIKGLDGKIKSERTYGKDPERSKG